MSCRVSLCLLASLLLLPLAACESGQVSLGDAIDGPEGANLPEPEAEGTQMDGEGTPDAGESDPEDSAVVMDPPAPISCGDALCGGGMECCSESCSLCTPEGTCRAIRCGEEPLPECAATDCTGPMLGAPNRLCEDGSTGGPVCARNDAGECAWSLRDCPTTVVCGTRGAEPCADELFCRFVPESECGANDHGGVCAKPPLSCPKEDKPICGCDGNDYPSPCVAASQGVAVGAEGKCDDPPGDTCGGFSAATCEEGFYCDYSTIPGCGLTDGPGVCREQPQVCTDEFRPVCGCDGATYDNPCHAASEGVSIKAEKACEDPGGPVCGGLIGAECTTGLFCDYALGDGCDVADGQGRCRERPEACTLELNEVCGCDGKSYSNPCAADAAGVSIRNEGTCK